MIDIEPQFEHSKVGNYMFKMCAKWTKFLIKHKLLYYVLSCTWGCIMTIIGLLCTAILGIVKLFNKNISFKKYHWVYSISIGPDYWGGFSAGLMFVRDQKSDSEYLDTHEFSHTFQNCLFGPFMLFIVVIPSAIRWWVRILFPKKAWPAYDFAWFEDSASKCGEYAHSKLK